MNLPKSLQLVIRLFHINAIGQLSFPNSFFLAIISKIGRMAVLLIFFEAIFLHTDRIGTWTHEQVVVLITVYLTFESLIVVTFHRNLLYYLPQHLRKGTFDRFLIQPISPLRHVAFEVIDLMDLLSIIFVIGMWIYVFTGIGITFSFIHSLLFLFACGLAIAFSFSLSTIMAALSFSMVMPSGLGRLYEQIFRFGRYPTNSLGTGPSFFLSYVIPVATIGTLPASILTGTMSAPMLLGATGSVLIMTFISRKMWQAGLRHYSSASS